MSFFIHPVVTMMTKHLRIPRALATLIVLGGSILFFFTTIIFIVTELIQSSTELAEKLPTYFEQIMTFFSDYFNEVILPYYQQLMSLMSSLNESQHEAMSQYIQDLSQQLTTSGATILKHSLLVIPEILSILPQSLTSFIIAMIATFLMTKDWPNITTWLHEVLPAKIDRASKKMFYQLKKSLFGFIKAQLILVLISGMIIYLGLLIIDIKYALTISLFAILADLLPLLGTGIIFVPWILYLFLSANYSLTISLSILYMIVIISRQILEPKILSEQIGINPLFALIILFLSLKIWGILGIILTPLILIFFSAAYRTGFFTYLWQFIKGDYQWR